MTTEANLAEQAQERAISRVLKAIDALRNGKMVIMIDDEDRENEGDLVFAAEFVTPEKINFMAKEARGLICLTLTPDAVDRLKLPLMSQVTSTAAPRGTAFTVSIEARRGVSTGISAADRAETIRVAVSETSGPDDIVVPGHIFPLRAKEGGVLERSGHTEGSVDLAKLAGLKGAAVICEIMKDDGEMARVPDLEKFAEKHDLPIVQIADLTMFRLLKDSLVEKVSESDVHTASGTFRGILFRSLVDHSQHLALVKGVDFESRVVDVRVHRQRPLIDVFTNDVSGGRSLIVYGINMLKACDAGILLYLTHNDPQGAIAGEIHHLGERSPDKESPIHSTGAPMDSRLYGIGAQILRSLGVKRMRLHATSSKAFKGIAGFGLEVTETQLIHS